MPCTMADKKPLFNSPGENLVKSWVEEIDSALKREKTFREEGTRVQRIYEAMEKEKNPFNILYSNTETLAPALYSTMPRPVVRRRYKNDDPLAGAAAKVGQRILEYFMDTGDRAYSEFDDLMKRAVLEALVPGRGLVKFKYDFKTEKYTNSEGQEAERVAYETVCGEELPWNKFVCGFALRWEDVPWQAIEHLYRPEEFKEAFPEFEGVVPPTVSEKEAQKSQEAGGSEDSAFSGDEGESKFILVWEIWDARKKKVFFIAPAYKQGAIKDIDDPLKLSGFFPVPKQLAFVSKISSIIPSPLYTFYEGQAQELNRLTVRINRIVRCIKVRGGYDAKLGPELSKILEGEDGELTPVDAVQVGATERKLADHIWLMPLEELITTLRELIGMREQVKQVIYEITGLSDVLRGSTVASETATAQELKNQWGSLRMKRPQKEVQRFVRESLRIQLEIAVNNLSEKTIRAMTGLDYPSQEEIAQAQMVTQQWQQQQAMMQQQAQMATAPGMPPQPQQPPPQPSPEVEKAQAILSKPPMSVLLDLLKNDLTRQYRIDIETNSTVDAEVTEDKEQVTEFLNALAQFLNGIAPLVEQGMMPFPVAKAILLSISRRFRFGDELDEELNKMTEPPPKAEDPAEKMKQDTIIMQEEQKRETMKLDHQIKMEELEIKRQELEFKKEEMKLKLQQQQVEMSMNLQQKERESVLQVATAHAMPKKEKAEEAAEGGENATV